ncbi:hypothetical protein ACHAW5_011134 [Stephanodiscus triporus]|uniref:Uncharacterized protein n=1 Tax=Stephanodiscus triporus TaxID=2934178 RepID=A0ABD3NQ49_9STRA
MSAPISFSVTYVFPSCKITPKCVGAYPIRVIIEAHDTTGSVVIWNGDQKSLFRKYATKRKAAQEDIVTKLNAFKASRL